MGGFGSGRSSSKLSADSALSIDLALMLREGQAHVGQRSYGTLIWTFRGQQHGAISYAAIMDVPGQERLELSYRPEADPTSANVNQTIPLTFTQPPYGGKRWWMLCPISGDRVGKLYMPIGGDKFASRQVWRLTYRSQRIAARDRPCEALFRLQEKLGCEPAMNHWPLRPKGMWHRTYIKHMQRYMALNAKTAQEYMAVIQSIKSSLDRPD
jgi:hypothetical protein